MLWKYKYKLFLLKRILTKRIQFPQGFKETKSIFIHIPKTAGNSVSEALYGEEVFHIPAKVYQKILKDEYNAYFKFAFVRNPLSRIRSAYEFLKRGGLQNKDDKMFKEKVINKYPTFEKFVIDWLNRKNMNEFIHFIPQIYFLSDSKDNIIVDFIGKVENINSDFKYVCKKLGLIKQLKELNKTNYNKSKIISSDVQDKIRMLYKKDHEILNY